MKDLDGAPDGCCGLRYHGRLPWWQRPFIIDIAPLVDFCRSRFLNRVRANVPSSLIYLCML